ncbi:transposase [Halostagnicola bangensis]
MSKASEGSTAGLREFDKYELDFSCTVHIDGPIEVHVEKTAVASDAPDIDYLVSKVQFDGEIPDSRAKWHHNYKPIEFWMLAHILREARGLNISELHDRLHEPDDFALLIGFLDRQDQRADPPGYTQLRDIWEETFTPRHRGACKVISERLVEYARDEGLPAPERVFTPDDVNADEADEDDPTIRELTVEKTGDVWEHMCPMVLKHWELKRHHNWQVPDSTFFDAQAYLATESDDVFPESGLGNMSAKSDHDRVHYPSTHRRELKKFEINEIRELLQSVTRDLVRKARREGELVGKLAVAIDQTKGHPWTGEIEHNEDGDNIEPWILGYKNDNDTRTQYYFQWATVQVVGLDIPIVLDAVPVRRGMTKGEIVDELLATATDLVDDIELVMMDAGFDSEAAKNAAEKHDVYYLNRKSKNETDKRRMWSMWENGETIRIYDQEQRLGMPTRKTLYVPNIGFDEDDEDDGDDSSDSLRQELIRDFGAVNEDEFDDDSPFEELLSDIREEEEEAADNVNIGEVYVPFETNHPLADKRQKWGRDEIPKREQQHAAARMIRTYGNRWGIENGYKKIGQFLPRSGSKDHTLRFFGFAFACTLYNAWRLVDLLVKLSVEDDPEYTPLVTASRFLAVAEGQFGLKPPPSA